MSDRKSDDIMSDLHIIQISYKYINFDALMKPVTEL